MQAIVINIGNDEPWSWKGWTLQYKRIGESSFAYKLVDPSGYVHGDVINNGFFLYNNVSVLPQFVEGALKSGYAKNAMQKYILHNDDVIQEINL